MPPTTVLAGLTLGFRGEVVGTLLGDSIAVRARTADVVAAATMALLGLVAIADVLYLDVRERSGEIGVLRAGGWGSGTVGRLVVTQGLAVGLLGSAAGAALGVGAVAAFAGALPTGLLVGAGGVLLAGTAAAGLAAGVPAWLIGRTPVTRQLAAESQ